MIYPLTDPIECERCGAQNSTWNVSECGAHMRADCPQCGTYIKFVGKRELDLPTRSVRSSDLKPKDRYRILARDGFRCVGCGKPAPALLHVDHIIPVISGGDDCDDNLVTLCEECNLGKSDGFTLREQFALWLRVVQKQDRPSLS